MTDQPNRPLPPTLRSGEIPASPLYVAPKPTRHVPVIPGTLLGLELMLYQSSLDLRSVSHLLRADPGALLHLFAILAEETERVPDAPCRVEDCIASLPLAHLLERLVNAGSTHHDHAPVVAFARHAVSISRHAQRVADSLHLPAEQASLIGLLHELGTLPWVLGWVSVPPTPAQAALSCEHLCVEYCVPSWLRHPLVALHHRSHDVPWTAVIDAAHELSQHSVISR